MSNEVVDVLSLKTISFVKSIINKPQLNPADTTKIISMLEDYPTILNHLSLAEISKLSILGVDLSRYMSAVHVNNIKVFVIKFASDSMMRVSKLIDLLNAVETKYYKAVLDNNNIHPKVAAEMIDRIQESISASVNLMMKLTDNETLMNLFVVNLNSVNDTINENKKLGYTNTIEILPLASRKKVDNVLAILLNALADQADTGVDDNNIIDADYKEKNVNE